MTAKKTVTPEVKRKICPVPAARVNIIARMMRKLEWVTGESGPILAEEWGLDGKTVEGNATEASRRVASEVSDIDAMKTEVATVLRENLMRASNAHEYNAVAKLGDVVTRIIGARAPEKQEITFSEEQAKAKFRELVAKYPELAGK